MSPTDSFLKHDGLEIHYRVDGKDGAPWLVFSNSLMTDLTMWDEQIEALKSDYRILRYDQRGHGQTTIPPLAADVGVLAGDVLALVKALKIEKASFIGISLGGATMLRFGLSHPAYVDRLVICDTSPKAPDNATAVWQERIDHAKAHGMNGLADITVARWFPETFVAAGSPSVKKIHAMVTATPFEGFVACARALAGYDMNGELAGLKLPTAAVAGEKDGAIPGIMRNMSEAIAGCRFYEVPGSGHLINIDNPGLFLDFLKGFLKG